MSEIVRAETRIAVSSPLVDQRELHSTAAPYLFCDLQIVWTASVDGRCGE